MFSLKVFVTVAETGKMTTAAEIIFLTQPAVSMQIKSLEEFYGVRLFLRQPDGLTLTSEGQIVYNYAKKILQNFDLLNHELRTALKNSTSAYQNNKISIGSCILISELYMPLIIHKFMSDYPDVSVNCLTMDYDMMIKCLLENRLDVALVGYRNQSSPKNELLKFEQYLNETLAIIAPAHFDFPDHHEVPLPLLLEKEFIALKTECGISCFFNQFLEKNQVRLHDLKKRAVFCSGSAVKNAICSGFGWSILPVSYVTKELEENKVKIVNLKGYKKPLSRSLHLVYPRYKENAPVVNLFLQFARGFKRAYLDDGKRVSETLFKETVLSAKT